MIDDTVYTLDNGVSVQFIDEGVQYTLNDRTLTISGEWFVGEVHLDDKLLGKYKRDDSDDAWLELANKERVYIGQDEDAFAEFAKQMLS